MSTTPCAPSGSATDVRRGRGAAVVPAPFVAPVGTIRTVTTYSADDAFAYVGDTYSLRNPVERALHDEVERLRGLVARQADTIEAGATAVSRVTHDARTLAVALAAEQEARETSDAAVRAVGDLWGRLDPHTDAGGRARAQATRVLPHGLVAALDKTLEV